MLRTDKTTLHLIITTWLLSKIVSH